MQQSQSTAVVYGSAVRLRTVRVAARANTAELRTVTRPSLPLTRSPAPLRPPGRSVGDGIDVICGWPPRRRVCVCVCVALQMLMLLVLSAGILGRTTLASKPPTSSPKRPVFSHLCEPNLRGTDPARRWSVGQWSVA